MVLKQRKYGAFLLKKKKKNAEAAQTLLVEVTLSHRCCHSRPNLKPGKRWAFKSSACGSMAKSLQLLTTKTKGTVSSKATIGNQSSAWSAAKQDIKTPKYARKITCLRSWPTTSDIVLCPGSRVIKIGFSTADSTASICEVKGWEIYGCFYLSMWRVIWEFPLSENTEAHSFILLFMKIHVWRQTDLVVSRKHTVFHIDILGCHKNKALHSEGVVLLQVSEVNSISSS